MTTTNDREGGAAAPLDEPRFHLETGVAARIARVAGPVLADLSLRLVRIKVGGSPPTLQIMAERAVGHEARVELDPPIDGRKRFKAIIVEAAAEHAVFKRLDTKGGEPDGVTVPYPSIADARLVLTDALIRESLKADKTPASGDDADRDEQVPVPRGPGRFSGKPPAFKQPAKGAKAKPVIPAGIQTLKRRKPVRGQPASFDIEE